MPTTRVVRVVAVGAGLVLMLSMGTPASAAHKKVTSSNINALSKSLNKAKKITFEAVYKSSESGQNETITIAQSPPKSYFSASGGSVVDTGTKTYYCSTSGGTTSCLSAGTSNPFASLETLFSPATALAAFGEAKEGLISRALGVKVSTSSSSIAGQSSTCVTVTVHGTGGKYCVTKQGILSYSGAGKNYFELKSFTKSPSSSLFNLPAGATTETLPGGVDIP
jgi:hypothetical protein